MPDVYRDPYIGWVCPTCKATYAPWMASCPRCPAPYAPTTDPISFPEFCLLCGGDRRHPGAHCDAEFHGDYRAQG